MSILTDIPRKSQYTSPRTFAITYIITGSDRDEKKYQHHHHQRTSSWRAAASPSFLTPLSPSAQTTTQAEGHCSRITHQLPSYPAIAPSALPTQYRRYHDRYCCRHRRRLLDARSQRNGQPLL